MKRRKGYTMIEVLFAVFMVAASATIVAATMPIANVSRHKADLVNKATGMAQKQLEAVRGLGYSNATASQLVTYGLIDSSTPIGTNTYSFTNVDSAVRDNPALILPTGSGEIVLEQVDLDLRRVIVTVKYRDDGVNRSVSIGTLVANL